MTTKSDLENVESQSLTATTPVDAAAIHCFAFSLTSMHRRSLAGYGGRRVCDIERRVLGSRRLNMGEDMIRFLLFV